MGAFGILIPAYSVFGWELIRYLPSTGGMKSGDYTSFFGLDTRPYVKP